MAYGKTVVWPQATYTPGVPWLWSRTADHLWVACGGFFVFAAIAVPLSLVPGSGAVLTALFLHLAIVCNYPHITSTYQVILRERKIRPEAFKKLLWSTPVMLGMLVFVGFYSELTWGPLLRLYLTWSAHHYAAQHFGIAAMYCARAGSPLQDREKLPLQGAFLGIGGFMMLMANTVGGDPETTARVVGLAENGGEIPMAGFPAWAYYPGLALIAVSIGAFFLAEHRFRKRTGTSFQTVVWLLFVTNLTWFVLPNIRIPGHDTWMWPSLVVCLLGGPPFFHSAQYIAVTGHRSRMSGPIRPVWLFAGLVGTGFVIFHAPVPLIPKVLPIDALRGLLLLVAVLNVHHFWMDGLIWRRARAPAPVPVPAPIPEPAPSALSPS